jgi:hypothetical protein
MPTSVPIHGGFCRGWVRAETAAALEADGRRGRVIDLPGSRTKAAELGELHADIAAGMRLTEFADTGQCSTAYT